MNKIKIVFAAFWWAILPAYTQTAIWQMQPTDFSNIERVGQNLYKAIRNGKVGLIHADGTIVAPIENDAIGLYYEHKALLTYSDGHGERITGVLTDDGIFHVFANKYYTLNGQKFYSDGLLSVSDENGKLGYVDDLGNPVLGFDGKYTRIKPFTEGYAAVFRNKKYFLINKEGVPVIFRFKTVGEVNAGTNVYHGNVYIWDYDGKFYTFDVENQGVCKSAKAPMNPNTLDYLYCFKSISGRDKNVPFVEFQKEGIKGLSANLNEGLYGFNVNDKIVLPNQFSSATQFEDGYSVVNMGGRVGILKYIEDGTFSVSVPVKRYDFNAGKSVTCSFNLSIPHIWQNENIRVELKATDGSTIMPKGSLGKYSFNITPKSTEQRTFSLLVYGDGLKLYESPLVYSFVKKSILCPTCGKDIEICGGKHSKHQIEKQCNTCGKRMRDCPYNGKHPIEDKCITCGKNMSTCPYKGNHPVY